MNKTIVAKTCRFCGNIYDVDKMADHLEGHVAELRRCLGTEVTKHEIGSESY